MANEIGFKSYCWVVGTTSYRTDNFNLNIEAQLALLNEFRHLDENIGVEWKGNNDLQKKYYYFLKEKEFIKGDASRPDKDAREKTSGLVDIGLLTDKRELTEAGKSLLEISESGDFSSDNLFELQKDSYIYFKQMLKTHNIIDKETVRPFIVFLYVVSKTKYLSNDEFMYLLPLCVNREVTDKIIKEILASREENLDYETIILSVLNGMSNYKEALRLLQTEKVSEELLCTVGLNRKSKKYDKPYYGLYKTLKSIALNRNNKTLELYEAIKKLTNAKVAGSWRKYFFKSNSRNVIKREGLDVLNDVPVLKAKNIKEFNQSFFDVMHLFKAKATLSDYFDLNRRYFKATDAVLFEDGEVKLDVLPKCYVKLVKEHLSDIAFCESELLEKNVDLEEIDIRLQVRDADLYAELGKLLGKDIQDTKSARKIISDERYSRFNKLIDDKFNKNALIQLLSDFEVRNDENIRNAVTDNADIPTIFEYILGVTWYLISNREGEVLDYMNLSLDADLLPKTHAGGGEADLVWKYNKTDYYPAHTLLIEATLADKTSQRRMEMEPVSRHLGDYCLNYPETEAYCVFITTFLYINVISDFRARKTMEYYSSDEEAYIDGMKIIPLQTTELKTLLKFDVKYNQIFDLFDKAYNAKESPREWYESNIVRETSAFYKV